MLAAAVKRWARAHLIPDQPTGGAPLGGADGVTDGSSSGAAPSDGLTLAEVQEVAAEILEGRVRGRVVVQVAPA